ncbi:hypothetical protein HDV00_004530 [Rhizophlyctis rosea]|nr:hypothetical protein HDV00_004530 [Rhizophlyctis rosea]
MPVQALVPPSMGQLQNGPMLMHYPGMYMAPHNAAAGNMPNGNIMMYPNYMMPAAAPRPLNISTDSKTLAIPESSPPYNVLSPSPRAAAAPYTLLTPRRAQSPALRLQMGPMQARAQSPSGVYPKSPTSPMSPQTPASIMSPISPINPQYHDPSRMTIGMNGNGSSYMYNPAGNTQIYPHQPPLGPPQHLHPNFQHPQYTTTAAPINTINPHQLLSAPGPSIAGRMKAGRHSTSSLANTRNPALPRSASARVGEGGDGLVAIDTLIKEQENLKAAMAQSAVARIKENEESEVLLETLTTLTKMRLLQQ